MKLPCEPGRSAHLVPVSEEERKVGLSQVLKVLIEERRQCMLMWETILVWDYELKLKFKSTTFTEAIKK